MKDDCTMGFMKALLVCFITLSGGFLGASIVVVSYAGSFWEIWTAGSAGAFIVANVILSVVCCAVLLLSLVARSPYRKMLLGSVLLLVLADLYPAAKSVLLAQNLTDALTIYALMLGVHSYVIVLVVRRWFLGRRA